MLGEAAPHAHGRRERRAPRAAIRLAPRSAARTPTSTCASRAPPTGGTHSRRRARARRGAARPAGRAPRRAGRTYLAADAVPPPAVEFTAPTSGAAAGLPPHGTLDSAAPQTVELDFVVALLPPSALQRIAASKAPPDARAVRAGRAEQPAALQGGRHAERRARAAAAGVAPGAVRRARGAPPALHARRQRSSAHHCVRTQLVELLLRGRGGAASGGAGTARTAARARCRGGGRRPLGAEERTNLLQQADAPRPGRQPREVGAWPRAQCHNPRPRDSCRSARDPGQELQPPPVCRAPAPPSCSRRCWRHSTTRRVAGQQLQRAREGCAAAQHCRRQCRPGGEAEAATHSEEAGAAPADGGAGADALLVAALRLGARSTTQGEALLPPAVTPTPSRRARLLLPRAVAEFEAAGGGRPDAASSPCRARCPRHVAHLVARSEDPPTHFRLQKRLQARAGGAVRVLLAARHMVVPAAQADVAAADGLRFVVRNTAARGRRAGAGGALSCSAWEDADVEVFRRSAGSAAAAESECPTPLQKAISALSW